MPLPDAGVPWPPPAMRAEYAELAANDTWYSGDPARLRALYHHDHGRPSERRRWWHWSARHDPQPGRPDHRVHVPLAGDIAGTSADLLFAEPPAFSVEDTATQARLDEITRGIARQLAEAAEVGAALGGVYLRATWDLEVARRPILTAVHPDCAVPEMRLGHLIAVTFWRELAWNGAVVLRHLERHEPGRILHGLYQGTGNNLGRTVPLTDHPDTAGLVDSLDADGQSIATGITDLTAVYIPNVRPNRRRRGSPFGRSDLQNLHPLLDALDHTWTSWQRDIRIGAGRLIVPNQYLTSRGPGHGAAFEDREIWAGINAPPDGDQGLTVNQFAIRVDEHERSAAAAMSQAVRLAGYSVQSFGLTGDVAVTATEVTARERRSLTTRSKKTEYMTDPIEHMAHVMLQLDRVLGFTPGLVVERPVLHWPDGVSEDPKGIAETLSLLEQAGAISTWVKVRRLNPDWDDADVQVEVDRIRAERGLTAADPTTVGADALPDGEPDDLGDEFE